jgi:ribosome-associated translation inhibitor RaiA
LRIRVSSPGYELKSRDVDRIERDLEKIDRRLHEYSEVVADVRISNGKNGGRDYNVTVELDYGRNHLMAKADHPDMGQAVREAREELLRQINDRSRRGHSSFLKRR